MQSLLEEGVAMQLFPSGHVQHQIHHTTTVAKLIIIPIEYNNLLHEFVKRISVQHRVGP